MKILFLQRVLSHLGNLIPLKEYNIFGKRIFLESRVRKFLLN